MDQLSSFHKTFFWCTKSVTFPVEAEREREREYLRVGLDDAPYKAKHLSSACANF
jgi:hypothetical protein